MAYSRDLAGYAAFLQDRNCTEWAQVDPLLLIDYLTRLKQEGLSARSRARILSSLRGFHRFLVREHYAELDPTALIESPRTLRSLPELLSMTEVDRLLAAVGGKTPSPCVTGRCLKSSMPPVCASLNWSACGCLT